MLGDPAVRRSLDSYVLGRIRGIPDELADMPEPARAWKCGSGADFAYGYCVGRIEEGAMRYLLKATRGPAGGLDRADIRDVIGEHRDELLEAVRRALQG